MSNHSSCKPDNTGLVIIIHSLISGVESTFTQGLSSKEYFPLKKDRLYSISNTHRVTLNSCFFACLHIDIQSREVLMDGGKWGKSLLFKLIQYKLCHCSRIKMTCQDDTAHEKLFLLIQFKWKYTWNLQMDMRRLYFMNCWRILLLFMMAPMCFNSDSDLKYPIDA